METTETPVETPENPIETPEPEIEVVPRSDHKRVLDDMMKWKKTAKELESKIKQLDVDSMKKNQEWQRLAEMREQEAAGAKEELERIRNNLIYDRKFGAVRESALKSGIRQEALDDLELLGLDDVLVETTNTGRVSVVGADDYVKRLKATKPHWFGGNGSKVNPLTPDIVESKSVTYDDLVKAEEHARKTGDYAPYKAALDKYRSAHRG